jgi:hypothetical protein
MRRTISLYLTYVLLIIYVPIRLFECPGSRPCIIPAKSATKSQNILNQILALMSKNHCKYPHTLVHFEVVFCISWSELGLLMRGIVLSTTGSIKRWNILVVFVSLRSLRIA